MGRAGDIRHDFLARFKTPIDQLFLPQEIKRSGVVVTMLGLSADGLFPFEAQPGEVFKDCRLERRPAAPLIDVLYTQ